MTKTKVIVAVFLAAISLCCVVLFSTRIYKSVSEEEALKAARIEFDKMRSHLRQPVENYEEPQAIQVDGGDVRYSFVWQSRKGSPSIFVRVTCDGWATASVGTEAGLPSQRP